MLATISHGTHFAPIAVVLTFTSLLLLHCVRLKGVNVAVPYTGS